MQSIYITLTAHSPLSRIEATLEVLKGYETLELDKEVEEERSNYRGQGGIGRQGKSPRVKRFHPGGEGPL